jgi:hypothetical protein
VVAFIHAEAEDQERQAKVTTKALKNIKWLAFLVFGLGVDEGDHSAGHLLLIVNLRRRFDAFGVRLQPEIVGVEE